MPKETIEYTKVDHIKEEDLALLQAATSAMESAYAPYSNFHVGAALQLDDGQIVAGSNQENAAYPSGLCAERVAIFSAHSQYPDKKISKILVMARNQKGKVANAYPCGSCRQVMLEFASLQDHPVEVIMRVADGGYLYLENCKNLLPFSFHSDTLH
jgi:cytidine deaminase